MFLRSLWFQPIAQEWLRWHVSVACWASIVFNTCHYTLNFDMDMEGMYWLHGQLSTALHLDAHGDFGDRQSNRFSKPESSWVEEAVHRRNCYIKVSLVSRTFQNFTGKVSMLSCWQLEKKSSVKFSLIDPADKQPWEGFSSPHLIESFSIGVLKGIMPGCWSNPHLPLTGTKKEWGVL